MSFIPKQPVTELWRPLMGVAQGGIARLIEEGRQIKWEDSAYTEENYYGLSLRGVTGPDQTMGGFTGVGETTFIFPVGPQAVRTSREYRQAISPTLGGLVVEERGIAWMDITVEGNFGLSPKFGSDNTGLTATSSNQPFGVPWMTPLSGPKWTQRMFAHFLDRYAAAKARPDENHKTTLVWHDFKNDEHWIVIPIKIELNRTLQDRLMYPFTMQFRAVARTTAVMPPPKPPSIARILAAAQNAVRMARAAVGLIGDAADTLTAALGQVRYYAATIDSVLDAMTTSIARLQYFLETKDRLASDIGGLFFRSITELTQVVMDEADVNENFPEASRQALYSAVDQYDRMAAQPALQVTSTQQERRQRAVFNARSATQTALLSTGSASSAASVKARAYNKWAGWRPYVIQAGDTLRNIAANVVGDPSKWYEIALMNSLKAPYVSVSGLPGTATIGDTIMIPTTIVAKKTSAASASDDTTALGLYGRDIRLYETAGSRPGRTQVDIRIDPKTGKDVARIEGVANLVQACQLKLWTEQGTHMLDPSYGTPMVVGYPSTGATVVALRSAIKAGLSRDTRIARVLSMTVVAEDDTVDVEATVLPVGGKAPVVVGVSAL